MAKNSPHVEQFSPIEKILRFSKLEPCTVTVGFHFWGRLKKKLDNPSDPKNPCSNKLGISCLGTKPFVDISKLNPSEAGSNDEQIMFSLISSNAIQLDFIYSDRSNNVFEVETSYELAPEVCIKLGKSKITLNKGSYPVSYKSDGTASTKISVTCK